MANSHPGSYCGQDAYSDMFITEKRNVLRNAGIRTLQGIRDSIGSETKGLQGCHGSDRGGVQTWMLLYAD